MIKERVCVRPALCLKKSHGVQDYFGPRLCPVASLCILVDTWPCSSPRTIINTKSESKTFRHKFTNGEYSLSWACQCSQTFTIREHSRSCKVIIGQMLYGLAFQIETFQFFLHNCFCIYSMTHNQCNSFLNLVALFVSFCSGFLRSNCKKV